MIILLLFDPVIDTKRRIKEANKGYERPKVICCHCYRIIKGNIYYYEDKPFDEFCYQFRYVLFPAVEEDEEKRKLLEKALERDRKKSDSED